MMALVHDERVLWNRFGVHLIGVEKIDEFRFCGRGFLGRDESNFVRCWAGCDLTSEGQLIAMHA
jgi:hypothetical protein